MLFKDCLMFVGKARSLPERVTTETHSGRLPAFLAKFSLDWKGMPGTNTFVPGVPF